MAAGRRIPRISLTEPAGPQFGALWEQMARYSYKTFRYYMGLPGRPIDFADQYRLSDTPPQLRAEEPDPEYKGKLCHDRNAAAEFRIRPL